ncbi:MAG: hypothetical protein AB8G15_07855 [Saprospiraceae bacterium]
MDLQKAKIILDKINSLYKSMGMDEKNIAPIERDLMRDYIRQFYEAFTVDAPKTAILNTKTKVIKARSTTPPPAPKPKVKMKKTPPPPPVIVVEEVEEKIEEKVEVLPSTPAPTPVVKIVSPPVQEKKPVVQAAPPVAKEPEKTKKEHETLFEYKEAKELSERLSELPIKDLSKALGLNEKIFTITELFGGDSDLFERTIMILNGMKDYDEAKKYLSNHIADKYNWATREKKNKAKNFIKLVRRRYK